MKKPNSYWQIRSLTSTLLLNGCTGKARTHEEASRKLQRALNEFRIRGVKNNIPFLLNVLSHPKFLAGGVTTSFIDTMPELFQFPETQNRFRLSCSALWCGSETLHSAFLQSSKDSQFPCQCVCQWTANSTWHTHKAPKHHSSTTQNASWYSTDASYPSAVTFSHLTFLFTTSVEPPAGWRSIFTEKGPKAFAKAVRAHKGLLLTDTTMRDAHQSLLATRVRTKDLLTIAPATAHLMAPLYRYAYQSLCEPRKHH